MQLKIAEIFEEAVYTKYLTLPITVQEILEWLSNGASQQQILEDYPQLEPDDFLAVYACAAAIRPLP